MATKEPVEVKPTEALGLNDSPEETARRGAEADLARRLAKTRTGYIQHFMDMYKMPFSEALESANKTVWTPREKQEHLETKPADEVSWYDLDGVAEHNMDVALAQWERIKQEAQDHLEAGRPSADAIRYNSPWELARFVAIRRSFMKEWQPQGGVEQTLLDQLAQCHFGWLDWLEEFKTLHNRELEERSVPDGEGRYGRKYEPPRISHIEYTERDLRNAERFQRMFMRSLRALRDLRRYAPNITIQNNGQVNIAGQQQVNVKK